MGWKASDAAILGGRLVSSLEISLGSSALVQMQRPHSRSGHTQPCVMNDGTGGGGSLFRDFGTDPSFGPSRGQDSQGWARATPKQLASHPQRHLF